MQSKSSSSQKVGLFSAIIICMNAMIGAGIFTTPAKLALSVGPAGIITYLIVIAAVLCMALSLSRVAFLYPEEGSFYTYTKQWGGHFLGILSAGAYITGIIIAMGLLIQMVIQYIPPFIPYVHDLDPRILGTIILIIISSLNIAGIRIMQTGQFLLIGCTLFALFSTIFVCLSNANTQNLKPFMPYGWTSLIKATSAAIFAFFGFESAASLYSVVQNPEKNVPRALTASLIIVGTIYLTFISSIILAIPKEIFTNPRIPVSQAIIAAFDGYHFLAQFIGLTIMTAILGVLQSMIFSSSTLTLSLLKLIDLKITKPITTSKYNLKIVIALASIIIWFNFIFVESMGLFFNLTALFIVFAYATSILTLVIKKHNKTLMQKLITYSGLITAAIIFLNASYGVIEELVKF